MPPAWSFAKIDAEHFEWGVDCNSECLVRLIRTLRDLEKLGTWGEVFRLTNGRRERTRNHMISVSDIIPDAQRRLSDLNMDDIDELSSLALGSHLRLWGIMQDAILRIVWIDKNHAIYPIKS